jgi:thymidine kinase
MDESHDSKKVKAVDFDGTLAYYDGWKGPTNLGKPIKDMVERVKKWISDGNAVVVFTARADNKESISAIEEWTKEHIGTKLRVTNIKEPDFSEFYDDRAVRVEKNTGKLLNEVIITRKPVIIEFLEDLI